jgi:Uma2 family endonuclease
MEALQMLFRDSQQAAEIYDDISAEEDRFSKDGLAVSEEEYWEIYYNDPEIIYEWKNGFLEVRPVSDVRGSRSYRWFCGILECYFQTNPAGTIINLDIGFRMELPDGTSIRIPDLSVVLDSNTDSVSDKDCKYSGIFDICVESLSYSSSKEVKRDTVTKKAEYEAAGVREYYILDARGKKTAFYSLNQKGKYEKLVPEGDIVRSRILPGFQFRVSDLYRQPSFKEMAEDGVYSGYVLPFYAEEKQRAEKEKLRAEKEKLRAEKAEKKISSVQQKAEKEKLRAEKKISSVQQKAEKEKLRAEKAEQKAEAERERAERLAAKLMELGISPE